MALTYSSMLSLGESLPNFLIYNTTTDDLFNSTSLLNNKPTLLMFICNHCPFVIHYHFEIKRLYSEYKNEIDFVAVNSNDIENFPEDNPEKMKELFQTLDLQFPYLFDASQTLAKKLKAECTPEFYLFDNNQKLIYRGRLDDSSPKNNKKITGRDLRNAINSHLSGKKIEPNQFPSMGCNIKWIDQKGRF